MVSSFGTLSCQASLSSLLPISGPAVCHITSHPSLPSPAPRPHDNRVPSVIPDVQKKGLVLQAMRPRLGGRKADAVGVGVDLDLPNPWNIAGCSAARR